MDASYDGSQAGAVGQRARVICNPASGGGSCDPAQVRDQLPDLEWIETEGPGDALRAAEGFDDGLLVVAGGDGTLNEVVNGLGKSGFPEGVMLALLPTGTGNDLAATLNVPEKAGEAEALFRRGEARLLDVARVRSRGIGERYFLNVATGGWGRRSPVPTTRG